MYRVDEEEITVANRGAGETVPLGMVKHVISFRSKFEGQAFLYGEVFE